MSSPDPDARKEIDALIYAENRKRERRNARFWIAALIVGIVAALATALVENPPLLKALSALIAFIGIFGFLAYLSARKSFKGLFSDADF